jgi:uncharacterized membrane protein YkvA (DUF1232 family)
MLARLKAWARSLKTEIHALYLAAQDPRTPWYAKVLVSFVAAYALSPIDLIPDFIPVIGYLDDLIILPLGIFLAVRLVPAEVLAECRVRAAGAGSLPISRVAAAVIIGLWIAGLGAGTYVAFRWLSK